MISIKTIRENPERIEKDLERRNIEFPLSKLRERDREWITKKKKLNDLRHRRNIYTEKIAEKKKKGKTIEKEVEKMQEIKAKISQLKEEVDQLKQERNELWLRLPNLLSEDVPPGKDDSENVEIKRWGKEPKHRFKAKGHFEICTKLGVLEKEKASEVAGEGFYYLKGDLVTLDYALQLFAMEKLVKKGYTPVEPPLMLRNKVYELATDPEKLEDMYEVKDLQKYLIGTSEHPLVAMHKDDVFQREELPLKYVAVSPCFRKEAGTHGKYRKGLYRMHQFNKVEQVVFCEPKDTEKMFEELQENTEQLYQELKIPYRVVLACAGDTPRAQYKMLDTELWMADGKYREAGSNSITRDYQSRRLNIKYEKEEYGEREYLHTLNNTALATSRTMLSIIETNQTKKGNVKIPKKLQKYLNKKKIKPIN